MLSYAVLSHLSLAHQAPLSMGFSRQEYWSGLPCLPPGGLPDPGIEPASFTSLALAGRFFAISATWEALHEIYPEANCRSYTRRMNTQWLSLVQLFAILFEL